MHVKQFFHKNGYVIFDNFLTPGYCIELMAKIQNYYSNNQIPEVIRKIRGRSLNYRVIDGERIESGVSEFLKLSPSVLQMINEVSENTWIPLQSKKVAININITPPGGEYRWHYDRNSITGILYLNKVSGGETELYPNFRWGSGKFKFSPFQRYLDQLSIHTRFLQARPVRVEPCQGRLLIMRGDRCLHSVCPVQGDETRFNIIFAFDAPGRIYPIESELDRYLYTSDPGPPKDPNYVNL